jgi:hypothetical protein
LRWHARRPRPFDCVPLLRARMHGSTYGGTVTGVRQWGMEPKG